jgi:hypothetical protein
MNQHIAAPWTLHYDGQIDGPNGETVCRFSWDSFKEFNDDPKAKATARLIVAAPDMLAALEALYDALCSDPPDGPQKIVDGDGVIYRLDGQAMYQAINKVREVVAAATRES